jgi:ankyrin repeat protein
LNRSAVTCAWEKHFTDGYSGDPSTSTWPVILGDTLDGQEIPPVSKIVLGVQSGDLATYLQLSTSHIDDTDIEGFTALSWAAARGDYEAVSCLLDFGADPNIPTLRGRTALILACEHKGTDTLRILERLMESGARRDMVDSRGQNALMTIVGSQQDQRYIDILANPKDINQQSIYGDTAIAMAAWHGNANSIKRLMEWGADATICDDTNKAPLFSAVQNNHHAVVELLVGKKVMCKTLEIQNNTIWHWAAKYADVETMRLLASGDGHHCFPDWDMENSSKKTAMRVFEERCNGNCVSEELVAAFELLYDSGQKFFDAFQFLRDKNESL